MATQDENSASQQESKNIGNDTPGTDQGRSAYSTGTTTQGGSDFGQGSAQLAGDKAYQQGSTSGAGSNYDNERGFDSGVPQSGTQQGGGAGGYDADREQQEINKEREDMHNERDPQQVDVEKPKPSSPDEQQAPAIQPQKD